MVKWGQFRQRDEFLLNTEILGFHLPQANCDAKKSFLSEAEVVTMYQHEATCLVFSETFQ